MTLAVGQRWLWNGRDICFVLEINSVSPFEATVIQSLRGISSYEVGHVNSYWKVDPADDQRWVYLPGQDRPV